MNSKFKFIDLFAGIGGFHHALSALGGQCVLTCEFDKQCEKIYKKTFQKSNLNFVSDIREITRRVIDDESETRSANEINKLVPDHDVLCGGFPCQPFSKSGAQLGFKDKTRGTLFFDILQIIEAKNPKFIFLENVRNIAGPRHTETWKTVVSSLRALGYIVSEVPQIFSPHLLPKEMGGAPQVRERVFIVGIRSDIHTNQLDRISEFNLLLNSQSFWNPDHWKITDFLDMDSKIKNLDNYLISDEEESYLEAWDFFVQNIPTEKLPGHPIWAFAFDSQPKIEEGMPSWKKDFLIKNSNFYIENKKFIDSFMKKKWGRGKQKVSDFPFSRQILEWQARKKHPNNKNRTLQDLVIQFRPSGIRVKAPSYLPALVAITQTTVVGPKLRNGSDKYRRLTPVEAARLQGIPDDVYASGFMEDKHAYKQLGNAVNVGIVRAVARVFLGIDGTEFPRNNIKQFNLFQLA